MMLIYNGSKQMQAQKMFMEEMIEMKDKIDDHEERITDLEP